MTKRKTNIELLRIISMFMIVVYHYCCHGYLIREVGTAGYNTPILWLIYTFCYSAVNIYVLISGYFLCKSEFKWKKVLKIYIEVLFYSVIIFTLLYITGLTEITSPKQILSCIFPIVSKSYWFVTIYVVMYIISPFLNKLINILTKKEYQNMLITLGIILLICNNLIPGTYAIDKTYGFGIIWFTYLYLVAAYIRIFDINIFKNNWLYLILYIVSTLMTYFSRYIITDISRYMSIFKSQETMFYGYNTITVFLAGVSLFIFFKNIKIPQKFDKLILLIAGTTFGIYLIHDNQFFRKILYNNLLNINCQMNSDNKELLMIISVISVFILCFIIDIIRKKLFEITSKAINNIKGVKKVEKSFKFSVIIPIYKVEEYLEETIESVINQTIGFEENIQLVLVNDGSPDNSEEICLKYKELYPDNVIYYKQENSGVSVARNKGMELATGEYVNFLDSDDKWSLDAFKIVNRNINKHPNIKIFSCQMQFFDAQISGHPLNYKYYKNKIINILEDYNYPQLSASSLFIKTEIAKKYKFEKEIKFSEDNKYINEILLDETKYMVLKKPIYYYRRRISNLSAIQSSKTNRDWYLVTPKKVYTYLFELSKKKFGRVIEYIQYLVMYDLQWRIKTNITADILTKEEEKQYIKTISNLLKDINDEIILEQRNLFIEAKVETLNIKYNHNIEKDFQIENRIINYKSNLLLDFEKNSTIFINVINVNRNEIDIAGQINFLSDLKNYKIYYQINNEKKELKLKESKRNLRNFISGRTITNKEFRFQIKDIKNKNNLKIQFFLEYLGNTIRLTPNYTVYGRLDKKLSLHYCHNNKIIFNKKGAIIIRKDNIKDKIKIEGKYFLQLLKNLRLKQIVYRYTAKLVKLFIKKEIWLISDRTMVANDNGMHFFKYVVSVNDNTIKPYFVIDKNSEDYTKMKKIGSVLPYNSFKYHILFLVSSKIISSQADGWVINAFGKSHKYYHDMYNFDFVFLQHGITKNDQTRWLNFINKNIKILVTATFPEYQSFLDLDYGYSKEEIKLTGFPRFDNLKNEPKKQIAIMPTWRQLLSGKNNDKTGIREYNPVFKESEYFKFYNNLINDKKLLEVMQKKGYTGIFVIHPSHIENYKDFKENDTFKVIHGYADYQKIFKESNLLISDYSSVTFDFAYLYKPVVYTTFDEEEFYKSHIYDKGYFNTKEDGFGPVCENYKSTIETIISSIEKDCILEEKYKKRIQKFFKYNDNNNCQRVYEEIKKM